MKHLEYLALFVCGIAPDGGVSVKMGEDREGRGRRVWQGGQRGEDARG